MFKHIFSFSGRIRRSEYAISVIMYIIAFVATNMMALMGMKHFRHTENIMLAHFPLFWFLIAQGAKRCHDLDQPSWWQVVPFYGVWLLLKDGQAHQNRYGDDPKHRN